MNVSTKKEPPLGPNYDGIQEYDNPVPDWWKCLFWIPIVIAPFYIIYYHGQAGRSLADNLDAELAANTQKKYRKIGELQPDEATLVKYMNDSEWVKVGQNIFRSNCVSCHGAEGGGNVGPNLCDENYKAVKEITDIVKVINEGLAGGAMPAWSKRLTHPNDVILVSAYVASLRGTKPANPKGPDGSPIAPWPSSVATSAKMPNP